MDEIKRQKEKKAEEARLSAVRAAGSQKPEIEKHKPKA